MFPPSNPKICHIVHADRIASIVAEGGLQCGEVEGHCISGFGRGGDAPGEKLELIPGAADDANAFLDQASETQRRFARVVDLVEGFESPFGLELLSTVHWVLDREVQPPVPLTEVVRGTHA